MRGRRLARFPSFIGFRVDDINPALPITRNMPYSIISIVYWVLNYEVMQDLYHIVNSRRPMKSPGNSGGDWAWNTQSGDSTFRVRAYGLGFRGLRFRV